MAKFPRFHSPAGVAVYPRLNKPDFKYDSNGVYSVKLRFTAEEAEEIRDTLAALREKAFEDFKDKVYKKQSAEPLSPETGDDEEETGFFLLNAKMKSSGKRADGTEWEQRPAVVDSKGAPVDSRTQVGGGSRLRFIADVVPFSNNAIGTGISLRLQAVQVIELCQYSAASEFDEVEDGYVAPAAAAEVTADAEASSGASADF